MNPPQSAILGMHKIEDRPVVEGEQIVIRPMMYVALSYDHRLIDGREAVAFLRRIKDLVENPERILDGDIDAGEFDLIVIGAGPGGYVAAIRAAELGMKTACIERDARPGGVCLNVGCIPSKALLESTEHYSLVKNRLGEHAIRVEEVSIELAGLMERKEKIVSGLTENVRKLMEGNGVRLIRGSARLKSAGEIEVLDPDMATARYQRRSDHACYRKRAGPAPVPAIRPRTGRKLDRSTEIRICPQAPRDRGGRLYWS